MNICRKFELFTKEFYLSLEGMDHFMEIQPQEQKGSNFFFRRMIWHFIPIR